MRARIAAVAIALCSSSGCDKSSADTVMPEGGGDGPAAEQTHGGHEHEGHHGHGPNAEHDGHAHGHHRFENAQEWAKHFDSPERDGWQKPDAVLSFLNLEPDMVVADLGAGTGYFAVKIAAGVPQGKVLANDIEPDMVRYLGERAQKEGLDNVVPVQGSATGPALPEPVDVAFMCDVYHHIADRPAYFAKVREQLKDGGRLVIVDFRKDAAEDAPGPPAKMRIAAQQLISELEGAGWTHVRTDAQTLPHQYIVELVPAG